MPYMESSFYIPIEGGMFLNIQGDMTVASSLEHQQWNLTPTYFHLFPHNNFNIKLKVFIIKIKYLHALCCNGNHIICYS